MDPNIGKGLGMAYRIGTELVVATVIGGAFGYLLDRWLGTNPWLLIVGVFVGTAAGFLNIYRIVSRMTDEDYSGPK
jgi:ATP synthase protein I